MQQEVTSMVQARRKEGQGIEGARRRWSQWWEKTVDNPLRQAADDMTTKISKGINDVMNDLEGRIQTGISSQTRSQVQQWARTGERPAGMMGIQQFTKLSTEARTRGYASGADDGVAARIGRFMGTRAPDQATQLTTARARAHGLKLGASNEERSEFLQQMQRDLSTNVSELGVGSEEMKHLGSVALDEVYGSMSTAHRSSWMANRSNKDKALVMAKQRINALTKNDELRSFFDRGESWYQKYGMLVQLEEKAGLGVLGVDAAALPGGTGMSTDFRATLAGAREMQKEAYAKIAKLSGSRHGKYVAGARKHLLGDDDPWGKTFEAFRAEGEPMDPAAVKRLLRNTELQQDVRLARKGDKAARQRLTKAALSVKEGSPTTGTSYGEAAGDRRQLRTLLDMVTKGTKGQGEAVDMALVAESVESNVILRKTVREAAAKLSRNVSRHGAVLEEGMGEEAFSAYKKIIALRESGELGEAMDAEKEFYQQYGGAKEGNFLLSHLRKSGLGAGMQEGLSSMRDFTRRFRGGSEARKAKTLMEMTLGEGGITDRGEIRKLLRGGMMRKITEGRGSPEELAKILSGRLSEGQLEDLADRGISQTDFVRKLQERIKTGEGGVTAEEVRSQLSGSATSESWDRTLGGAPKEQVDSAAKSLLELRKTNQILKAIYLKTPAEGMSETLAAALGKVVNGADGPGGNSSGTGGAP
jgi:hypothetical protein